MKRLLAIVMTSGWISALYYAIILMLWIQAGLLLDGTRHLSLYPITSAQFWQYFLFMSFVALISAAIVGLIIGIITGCVIAAIYFKSAKLASQPIVFKRVINLINLLPVTLLLVTKIPEVIRHDSYQGAWEDLGLLSLALVAAAFYTSRRFWRWWIRVHVQV